MKATRPRWFEDFAVGQVYEFGDVAVEAAEVLAFASRFDPQSFHVDAEAARQSPYGGLIASGWHTAALMMRMMVDDFIPRESSLGSPGVDELRWLQPVRPGDRLRVRLEVTAVRGSRSRPDRGVISQRVDVLNQRHEVVMRCLGMGMYRREPGF